MATFHINEKHLSQIPALQLLVSLGYEYLSPARALAMRGGKTSNLLLEGVLHEQLAKLNRIHYRSKEYHFSEANIQEAVQKLKNVRYDGLQKTNEVIYDRITLGIALEQTVEGNSKSFNLNYIDWANVGNNLFHVVPEYVVERSRSSKTVRPDVVLFVNGIPLAVIECKSPTVEVEQAVSQTIRNQSADYIPKLFTYVQLVMGVNKNSAQYATAGTSAKFWSVWNEREDEEDSIAQAVNRPLSDEQRAKLFSGDFASARRSFESLANEGNRMLTEQDKAIYSLCRPERLLELAYRFTLFERREKKIARYQQYFVVKAALARIKRRNEHGNRVGGIVWHTQGSGKSLTMVMLAKALTMSADITNPRVILVTDRDDLDKQLGNTFAACDLTKKRATSGRNLVQHLKDRVGIITTLIHKFDKGWGAAKFSDPSSDIFVLVDESHRTNFGSLAARMRQVLPNACYLGFTGTPLLKKEKSSFAKFGGLIDPHYSIKRAVEDKAILPLIYEGRHVEMEQNQAAIDLWFERHTADLTKKQQADLKKKYARAEMLNRADQVVYMRAFDISEHYRENWQGTGFKAQLVAPSKATALKYHEHLNDIGYVTSEVIISAPDTREGHAEVDEGPTDEVSKFWHTMMKRYGSEEEYTQQVIDQFKQGGNPAILIVVDKLLTGFDAPRNTVLYLCRTLREHNLLQAIARVNRLHEGKEFGYIIDYANVLGELDKALTMYEALAGFDAEDLVGTLTSVNDILHMLPQRYSALWDLFREVKNKQDEEEFERFLADDERRRDFYERLSEYSKALAIALSTTKFIMETDEAKLRTYKSDLKRFRALREAVMLRYAETVDYRDYDLKIKKLLDTHIQANEVSQLSEPVNIFDEQKFAAVKQGQGIHSGQSTAAKADTIAHATKKAIHEKMDEDPAFYAKFSHLIQQAIDDFRARRISGPDYFDTVHNIRDKVVSKRHDDVPIGIRENDEACAYYGVILPYFSPRPIAGLAVESDMVAEPRPATDGVTNEATDYLDRPAAELAEATSLAIQRIINKSKKVDFWEDDDAQKSAINAIDDFLYDEIKPTVPLSSEQMDEIIEKIMQIARSRRK